MIRKDFLIADFRLRIEGENWPHLFGHFGRALHLFEIPYQPDEEPLLVFSTDRQEPRPEEQDFQLLEQFQFAEVDASCRFLSNETGHLLIMESQSGEEMWFYKGRQSNEAWGNPKQFGESIETASLIRFGIWILFGLAIVPCHAIAIHSSAIRLDEGAALFLGESGTGKSTHTRLWREHIAGAELLNDDSPIIRFKEGIPMVYGSPWSGKTPCYKQEHYPIRGFVRLSQAPRNQISRLRVISAIGALLPSCPLAFAYDTQLQDAICHTLSRMISLVPVFHLECLPDRAAAELSFQTLFHENTIH